MLVHRGGRAHNDDQIFRQTCGDVLNTEGLRREETEGIHQHRHALTEGEVRPYAICETPAFILRETEEQGGGSP